MIFSYLSGADIILLILKCGRAKGNCLGRKAITYNILNKNIRTWPIMIMLLDTPWTPITERSIPRNHMWRG